MRHLAKWLGIAVAALGALAVALFLFAHTQTGLNTIGSLVGSLTGGKVQVTGLSGSFPSGLRAKQIVLSDAMGPWIRMDNIAIDGSVLGLIGNHLEARRLSASRVQVLRLPTSSGGGSPMQIDIAMLDIPDLETSAAVSGKPMSFAANGSVHMTSLQDIKADLTLTQTDPGTYHFQGSIENGVINGTIAVNEGNGGLIAGMLGLSGIGPIKLQVRATGPKGANQVTFALDAGPLHATGAGMLDLPGKRANVDFTAMAPAMTLRPNLGWHSLMAQGHMQGMFSAPIVDATLTVTGLTAPAVVADSVSGTVTGKGGALDVMATASGLRLASGGAHATLLASAPAMLSAHIDLMAPDRPVRFTLSHPAIMVEGTAEFGATKQARAMVTLSKLKPFAALGGVDLTGRAIFDATIAFASSGLKMTLTGTLAATGGDARIAGLLGRDAQLSLAAALKGSDLTIESARVQGAAADARLTGIVHNQVLGLTLTVLVPQVSRLAPSLKGSAQIKVSATGPLHTAELMAMATGDIGSRGFAPQHVSLDVHAKGLPRPSSGSFRGQGRFENAPVSLAGTFAAGGNGLDLLVDRGDWKSLSLHADIHLPRGGPSRGTASVHMGELSDLAPLIGQPMTGRLDAMLDFAPKNGRSNVAVDATARNVTVQQGAVAALSMKGDVADPLREPRVGLTLDARGIAAVGFSGTAMAAVGGGLDALSVKLSADLTDVMGRPATLMADGRLNTAMGDGALSTLTFEYRNQRATLAQPTAISYANGLSVDHFTLRSGAARLAVSGRLTPMLNASIDLDNLTAATLRSAIPDLTEGTVSGSARLTGTLGAPHGAVAVQGRGLRFGSISMSVPAGTLDARAALTGRSMTIDAALGFGASKLMVTGAAPLWAGAMFNLTVAGTADLSMLNAQLSASGRRVIGQAALNATVGGTLAQPKIAGSARVMKGEVQDYARGLRITGIAMNAEFRGKGVEIVQLFGKAGNGTISGSGTIDFSAPGIPLAITLKAMNAQPATSDQLRATLNADVTLTGTLTERLTVGGTITILRGESILPNSFPPTVATLEVIRPGQALRPAAAASTGPGVVVFDLTISSPGLFFVRGRGLEAELEGSLHIGGTLAAPTVTGAFNMRRGTFDLAGATLTFTTGKVNFEDASLRNRMDPALDFIAQTTANNVTAKLEITGTVTDPKIQLTSAPMMPQDEILAQVLFQQSVKQLNAFQLAQLADAAATLGGFGGGLNPVGTVRRTLGLDRLAVTSGPGNQTTVEAGKYIARNVYVGAKQGLQNTTQAEVQIDITKNLKLNATIAGSTNATVTQGAQQMDQGSAVGFSYQFEY
jgi:translocation and assembly module TamB